MSEAISLAAPAKINLHLHIGEKRSDGYHELLSLFQMVSLQDELRICGDAPEGQCLLEGEAGPPAGENLVTAACRMFRRETGLRGGVRIRCRKRIPEGAGLGGGSSDAAAVLRLCNRYFAAGLGSEELMAMGAELGSDVPFFLGRPAAVVSGRGEEVRPAEPRPQWPVLLVRPDFGIATGEAYRRLDELRAEQRGAVAEEGGAEQLQDPEELLRRFREEPPQRWGFYNSFTPVLRERFPFYGRFFERCAEEGALYANVSGSGSAAYALFSGEESLEACYLSLRGEIKNAWKLKMLASSPMPVYN
jgi:4-diphosphocytidyl-2-C-methyl-D-erythritol kinase